MKNFKDVYSQAIGKGKPKREFVYQPFRFGKHLRTLQWVDTAIEEARTKDKVFVYAHPKGNVMILSQKKFEELKAVKKQKQRVSKIIVDDIQEKNYLDGLTKVLMELQKQAGIKNIKIESVSVGSSYYRFTDPTNLRPQKIIGIDIV